MRILAVEPRAGNHVPGPGPREREGRTYPEDVTAIPEAVTGEILAGDWPAELNAKDEVTVGIAAAVEVVESYLERPWIENAQPSSRQTPVTQAIFSM